MPAVNPQPDPFLQLDAGGYLQLDAGGFLQLDARNPGTPHIAWRGIRKDISEPKIVTGITSTLISPVSET